MENFPLSNFLIDIEMRWKMKWKIFFHIPRIEKIINGMKFPNRFSIINRKNCTQEINQILL